jgi:hypothetical protein
MSGLFGIGVVVLTPGVRSAVVPACGLTRIPLRIFLPGLALGAAAAFDSEPAVRLTGAA